MLLELVNIRKSFSLQKGFLEKSGGVVRAVDNVSLQIKEGENISLVGESGCGKTTLARVIIKLCRQDTGEVIFRGENVSKASGQVLRAFRKNVQMVFQDPFNSLDPRYSIRRILREGFTLEQKKWRLEQEKELRSKEMLLAVKLKEAMLSRYPHEFSGGERQRIAIARALMLNPKLLILDEAVSSLDVVVQDEILSLLKDLQKQFSLTYLFISHNLKVVRRICDRTAVMYRGKIVELGPTREIFQNPLHPYTKELLAAALEYRSASRDAGHVFSTEGSLISKGNEHYVLGE